MRFLLDRGADPNSAMAGVPALHAAVETNKTRLVTAMLAAGADPDVRLLEAPYPLKGDFVSYGRFRGATPLWVATFPVHSERTPLNEEEEGETDRAGSHQTRNASYTDVMELLLAAGADPSLTTDDETTPLMVVSGLGHGGGGRSRRRSPSVVRAFHMLVDAGADVSAANEAGFTALHGAAFTSSNYVVQLLVDQGAALNAQDFMGRTPFRIAEGTKQAFSFRESPETAQLLRDLGADTSLGVPGHILERQLQRDQQHVPASIRP